VTGKMGQINHTEEMLSKAQFEYNFQM